MNALIKTLAAIGVYAALPGIHPAHGVAPAVARAISLQAPSGLMCQLLAQPQLTVITAQHPRFTWIVNASRRGARQTAYQIIVASQENLLRHTKGDLWDSGKVLSDNSTGVSYAGQPLVSNSHYWWAVRVWDETNQVSAYSAPQQFNTGTLQADSTSLAASQWVSLPDGKAQEMVPENRYPLERQAIKPVQVMRTAPNHYFIDFGRAAFGTLRLTLDSATNQDVEIRLGEMRGANNTVETKPGASIRYLKTTLQAHAGSHVYTLTLPPQKGAIHLPPQYGEVIPFRYCEIINSPSEINIANVTQLALFTHFDEGAASFTSSDPTLNAVWELCKYSIKATSFLGIYVDGDRERHPYEADAYINQLGHYSIDREYTTARYSHEYLIEHPTWPTEWILHSVLIAWADYLYTGDAATLKRHYDDLKAKTLISLEREDGLISTQTGLATPAVMASIHLGAKFPVGGNGFRDIVDWPVGERDGYQMQPINTVVNAFHYRALTLMSKIAKAAGKPDDARQFHEAAELVYHSFNAKLFDTAHGVYRDGEGTDHASLHANMFALAFGLVPEAHQHTVTEFIKSRGMACSVYGAQYLLEALYAADEGDYALQLMAAPPTNERGWAHMLDSGSTVTWEAWDRKFKTNLDWNHAWGAAPANIIPRLLMGIEPLAPGFQQVRIRPQIGTLTAATMTLPTIRGPIHVAVTKPNAATFNLRCQIPANMSAEVHLPTLNPQHITESGQPLNKVGGITFLRIERGRCVLAVGAGDYNFVVK